MLADSSATAQSGQFFPGIQVPETARHELLGFIADELPRWRDAYNFSLKTSEPTLNDVLCIHLNVAARHSAAWSHVVFVKEKPDEVKGNRAIDLAAIMVMGKRHTQSDPWLPIECKRLPTPKERKNYDEREYVITKPRTTGGMQRFKFGYHGANHSLGAMIGYIQAEDPKHWKDKINKWILDLAAEANSGWSASDCLELTSSNSSSKTCILSSHHERNEEREDIELQHIWIEMD